jgi:alkylation response protein AidB-like acyl-CoA dehydrogenase
MSSGNGSDKSADWVEIAAKLAVEFADKAAERERRREPPIEELKRVRETGLVNLLIPKEFGGGGGNWRDAVRVVVELSKPDTNIGLLVAYHFHNYLPPILDLEHGAPDIQRKSAKNRWLWGHVTHPWVRNFLAQPTPNGGFIVNGTKPMNTGAPTADVTTVLAERTDRKEFVYGYVPTNRKGLNFISDWDNLGLRRSDTSTIQFDNVVVEPDEVLPRSDKTPFVELSHFYIATAALAFGAAYLGGALGAIERAKDYTLTRARPAPPSGLASAAQDPYVLGSYGDFWIKTQAGLAALDTAAKEYDEAFARRPNVTPEDYARIVAHAEAFRSYAIEIGIEIGAKVYDVTGASATANHFGFDRYWRDVRNHSLHVHPPIYTDRILGDYFVNGTKPFPPSFFVGR